MNLNFCRDIDINYAIRVWSDDVGTGAEVLGMSPLRLVALPEVTFNAIVRTLPLEALDLISEGEGDEFELGMDRVPDDVHAQITALIYGIDAVEFLETPIEERPGYLSTYSDVLPDWIEALTPYQMNEYFACMANGDSRMVSLVKARIAPERREEDEQNLTG